MTRIRTLGVLGVLSLSALCGVSSPTLAQAPVKPNIVFVVADDLGYGDISSFGQVKIQTPHLDRLAREGMRLTRHYAGNAVCAPSRCVLMTGKHPGHAVVRDNRELQPEGQFPLPEGTETLPRRLQQQGYVTGAFGKWGLGGPGTTGEPLRQGIDRFFGYNCQRVAHNHYPTYLWDNNKRKPLDNKPFPAQGKLNAEDDPTNPASYARFSGNQYAPDLIADQAVRFVEANKDRPFFLFMPTTVPHLALQVPADSVEPYTKLGWNETPYKGGHGYLPHPTPHAAYAAMVSRMDREIGRIMDRVRDLGLDEQTIFVFTSDNGPLYDQLGGTDSDFFNSTHGLRGHKGSLYEGGVRVPCVVRWPNHIAAGTSSDRITGFEDWIPTLLELVGALPPGPGLDGISFAPTLRGDAQPARPFLYREFPAYGGQQAIWSGPFKAIRVGLNPQGKATKPEAEPTLELYNLTDDPAESVNLARANPRIVESLRMQMRFEHTPSRDFPFRVLDGEVRP